MIATVADVLSDDQGLNWPRIMAPFEVVVIPGRGKEEAALQVFDRLSRHVETQPRASPEHVRVGHDSLDIILDDRVKELPWKLKDADLIGYPIIVLVGRAWVSGRCEVQCRRRNFKEDVPLDDLQRVVWDLLHSL